MMPYPSTGKTYESVVNLTRHSPTTRRSRWPTSVLRLRKPSGMQRPCRPFETPLKIAAISMTNPELQARQRISVECLAALARNENNRSYLEEAIELLQEAAKIYRERGNVSGWADIANNLGQTQCQLRRVRRRHPKP